MRKDKEIEENKKRNRELAIISYFFAAIFVGMIVYLCVYQAVLSNDFVNNSYNKRISHLTESVARGDIVTRDGTVIATTEVNSLPGENPDADRRVYPQGKEYAHVLGYIGNGGAGLEKEYGIDMLMSHTNMFYRIGNDISGKKQPGDMLITTLDSKLQDIAYKSLKDRYGAIIAMNPRTGEVLAVCSTPAFDPNTIDSEWDSIVSDSSSSVLLNRATQGLYPPGSTFKLVTLLEYVKENPGSYKNFEYECNGEISYQGTTIHCYNNTAHGPENLKQALAKSCNGAFSQIGLELDMSSFRKTSEKLLFNKNLPKGDFKYYQSSFDLDESSDSSKIMLSSIGQGNILVTPYHMLLITSAIANEGVVMEPYVVSSVKAAGGLPIKSFSSKEYKKIMDKSDAALLQKYMKNVVNEGTASLLNTDEYDAYGKTGSAEYGTIKGQSHAWFVGYADKEGSNPIAVSIIVEGGGAGSSTAVPIAKEMFDEYFSE